MGLNITTKRKIEKLQGVDEIDLIKYELYAIFTTLILSKEMFSRNKEISDFLKLFGISFKEYIMKSRTLIISRVLRKIETADRDELQLYISILVNTYTDESTNNEADKTKDKKWSKDNYMSNILNKYSRNKR